MRVKSRRRGSSVVARLRERLAFDLAATKGLTEVQIAGELARQGLGEVSQQAVSKMLRRVEARMLKEMNEEVRLKKALQDAALLNIYRDAMVAWEASKSPQRSVTTKEGADGIVRETQTVSREREGDPRFLEQARQALADIRKIWGVDEPAQTRSDIIGRLGLEIVEEIVDAEGAANDPVASDATSVSPE